MPNIEALESFCLAFHQKMWKRACIETVESLCLALHLENMEACLYRGVGESLFDATSRKCGNVPIYRR